VASSKETEIASLADLAIPRDTVSDVGISRSDRFDRRRKSALAEHARTMRQPTGELAYLSGLFPALEVVPVLGVAPWPAPVVLVGSLNGFLGAT
jgi:hypothetical protein